MTHFLKKSIILFALAFQTSILGANTYLTENDSFSLNAAVGKALIYQKFERDTNGKIIGTSKTNLKTESLLHLGLGYHRLFSNELTLDAELSWLMYKSLCETGKKVTAHPVLGGWELPSKYLLFTPITDVGVSKNFGRNVRLGAGLTYLWGLYAKAAMSFDQNISLNCKCRWFFDRNLYHDGIHDMHLLIGVTYHL